MNGSLRPAVSLRDSSLTWLASWSHAARQRQGLLISLALAAITLAVYGQVIHFDFVEFDDDSYVTYNPAVQRGLTFQGVIWAFRGFHVANWHPVTLLSHMLDCSLFGVSPGGHHFTSLLFHAANTVLLFLVLRRMTGSLWPSAMVAALFAWHPLHVESVAWVAERKDVLSTFFLMLTIWAYVRYAERPRLSRYALVIFWFALGLMSKPMLVTLPLVLLLLDYWPLGRMRFGPRDPSQTMGASEAGTASNPFQLLLEKLPLFALSAAAGIATVLAQHEGNAVISLHSIPLSSRLGNAAISYAGYLGKMMWPVDLCVYYPLPGEISVPVTVCSALVLAGMSVLVWRARKQRPYLAVGWLWYLVTLLPVIGLVQVSGQAMADRYTYVPLVGVFIMIVWSVAPWFEAGAAHRSMKGAMVGVIFLGCLLATSFQVQHWRNGVRLFVHCLEVTRDNFLAHHNLGVALSARGHKSEAVAQFTESLRLYPNNAKGHYCLALDLTDLGENSEAIGHYAEVLRLKPRDAAAHLNLGVLLAQQKHLAEAIDHFRAVLTLEPDNSKGHLNLANALNEQGQTAEALGHYRIALELAPVWPEALNRFACVLATHKDARFRDGPTAVRLAESANQLTDHSRPDLLNTLAAAYAETGRYAEAVAAEQCAMQLVLVSGRKELRPKIQNCLQLYQAGKPYHEAQ